MTTNSEHHADNISSDLEALRNLDSADLRPGWLRQFAMILVLVSLFVVVVWLGMSKSNSGRPVVFNEGVSVAESFTGGGWVGAALDQAMVATIQSGEQLRLINPIQATTVYAAFGPSATSMPQSGAEWVLRTTVSAGELGTETVVARLELSQAGDAMPIHTAEVTGAASSISDLATRSADQVFAWLEVEGLSGPQLGYASSEIPTQAASELYGKGLTALASFDGHAALELFRAADAIAPDNAAIHEGLANTWELLGYAENAANETQLALRASENLSRRRQLELEAKYALRTEAWARAQEVFSALKEFSPENLSYRLAIADSLARQNDNEGFAESIKEMRSMDGPASSDPRIDLLEAAHWYGAGDYGRCLELSRIAEAKASQSGDQHLLGEALLSAGRCDDSYDPAVLLQARSVFKALAIPHRESEILRELSKHEFAKGRMPQYLSYLEQALQQAQRLGNEPEIAASQNSLAIAYELHGWLTRGYNLKVKVAEYQKQRNNRNRYSIMLENIGISLFKLGRYEEAEAAIREAEKLFIEIDDQIGIAWVPYRRGQIALRRGNIEAARTLMTQALENAERRPEGNLEVEATYELGLIDFYAGDYESAAPRLEMANDAYRDMDLSASIAESEIALAKLDAVALQYEDAEGHLASAENLLTEEVAYYAMSMRAEQVHFGADRDVAVQAAACKRLEDIVEGQEHREYLLRAKAKIVACLGKIYRQPYALSHAMLVVVEEEARRHMLFEALITAGYIRAALLLDAGREEDAVLENDRVKAIADAQGWRSHPVPGLKLSLPR